MKKCVIALCFLFLLWGCSSQEQATSIPAETTTVTEITTQPTEVTVPETTEAATTEVTEESVDAPTYVVNTNTGKFHNPDCHNVPDIYEENKQLFYGTRDELIASGYDPCGNCHP